MTEGSTTKYTINISSCACSDGPSCPNPDFCPIRVSSRSQAFPIPSRNGTSSVNCSTSSNCQLEVEQPVTDDWQYVMVECLQPNNVSFNLTVEFEGLLLVAVFKIFVINNRMWCPVVLYPPIRLSGGMNKSIPPDGISRYRVSPLKLKLDIKHSC